MRKTVTVLVLTLAVMAAAAPTHADAPVGGLDTASVDVTSADGSTNLTIQWDNTPTSGTLTIAVTGGPVSVGSLSVTNGAWVDVLSCTGAGTATLTCPITNAPSLNVTLRSVITVPQGSPDATYTVTITDPAGSDQVFFAATNSTQPTVAPTIAPTLAPTIAPTIAPTLVPTIAPTLVPGTTGPGETTTSAVGGNGGGSGGGAGSGSGSGTSTTEAFGLPATGADGSAPLLVTAGVMACIGSVLLLARRRPA